MNMCPFIKLLQEDGCIVCIVFGLVLSIPSLVLMSKVGACNSIHVGFSKTCVIDLFLTGTEPVQRKGLLNRGEPNYNCCCFTYVSNPRGRLL